jgi:propionyl-CoA carboxylase alpha chain
MTAAAAYAHTLLVERGAGITGRITPAPQAGAPHEFVVILDGQNFAVEVRLAEGGAGSAQLWMPALSSDPLELLTHWTPGASLFEGRLGDESFALEIGFGAEGYTLSHRGYRAPVLVCTPRAAELHARLPEKAPVDTAKLVTSPMPGLVVSIAVEPGQEVKVGQALMVVEAMKMENVLRAEVDGVIKSVSSAPGDSVAADELLIEFE